MPQLDSTSFISQLFWLAFFFSIICVFSAKYTLPHLAKILRDRWGMTEGTRQIALKLQREADDIMLEFNRQLDEARTHSHQQIVSMSQLITKEKLQRKNEFEHKLKERLRHFEIQVAQEKISATTDMQTLTKNLTSSIVDKILRMDILPTIIEDAVESRLNQKADPENG